MEKTIATIGGPGVDGRPVITTAPMPPELAAEREQITQQKEQVKAYQTAAQKRWERLQRQEDELIVQEFEFQGEKWRVKQLNAEELTRLGISVGRSAAKAGRITDEAGVTAFTICSLLETIIDDDNRPYFSENDLKLYTKSPKDGALVSFLFEKSCGVNPDILSSLKKSM